MRLRLLLTGVLFAVYAAVYTGLPASIDDEATLAVAANLVKYGTPDINLLGSAEGLLPPLARMGSFGVDGLLYAKKGITPSLLLLPLTVLSHSLPFLPVRAAALLLNPIITVLTAVLLYSLARMLNYQPRTAFLAALTYGLATFALVYTATLFGEPVAGLLLLAALTACQHYRTRPTTTALLIAGSTLGLAIGVNTTYALMAPLLGCYALGIDPRRWRISRIAALAAPVFVAVGLLLLYNLARFGSPLDSGYNFAEGEGFTSPFSLGVFGLLLSPYRGVFWFNPILLLVIPGGLLLWRRSRPLTAIILIASLTQIVTYASWWSWHGGIVWGPRFLLPVIPLLVILLLPVIDRVVISAKWGLVFALLFSLSLFIQLIAAAFSMIPHVIYLYENYAHEIVDGFFTGYDEAVVFELAASPVLAQVRIALSGEGLQPALLRTGDVFHALLIALIIGAALLSWRARRAWHRAVVIGLIAASLLGIAARQQHQMATAQAVVNELTPAQTIVAASTSFNDNLLELKNPTRIFTTHAPTVPDDPLASGLWRAAMQRSGLLWFITWFPPGSAENWQELALWQRAAFVREIPFQEHRALLFDLNAPLPADQEGGWTFGPIRLAQYGLQRRADGVRVTLNWQRVAPITGPYTWFVHLVDASNQIVMQQDRAPQGGFAPPADWQPQDTVTDYLFFPLDAPVDTSGWYLRVGWIDAQTGERLPLNEPTGAPIAEGFIVLPLSASHPS
jgi:hypothetical protein